MIKIGRTVTYNKIVNKSEFEENINPQNLELAEDFLEYLSSIDRSKETIAAYRNDLRIFWQYCYEHFNNKFFVDLSKREIVKFQNYCLNEWKWSPARMRRVKATLSSLSNYIENMCDDEYDDFKPIIKKIENPASEKVLEKSIFSTEQLKSVLDVLVENKQYDRACMLALAMANGRRKSELPRMKLSYFDDENIIYGSLYKTPETVKTKGRGSRGKQLIVYTLKNDFKPYLDMWLKFRKENNITSEWLIPAHINGEWLDKQVSIFTMDSWAKSFSRILGEPFYWHSVRHYFTTACSRSGLPDDVIQMLVGWNSADMVQIYKDIDADEQFEKYFSEDGITQVEKKGLADL